MRLAITVCATESYTYALRAQARRVQGMILESKLARGAKGVVILVGDNSSEMVAMEEIYRSEILPEGWEVKRIEGKFTDGLKNYKNPAQLVIARMRSAAFDEARRRDVDACLSLDSDVLPQTNALDVMLQSLEFDNGFYRVATCPYPSQGGGDFLAGRGIPENPILPDIYPDERIIPETLLRRMERHEQRLKELNGQPDKSWLSERESITQAINRCQPKGDVFFRNSGTGALPFAAAAKERLRKKLKALGLKELAEEILAELDLEANAWRPTGFRRRGWMSSSYPAIGIGCMLPTDWCGFGCTLMSREALALAQFDGYDGSGTEDLYVVYKRWHRAGLRISTIPHVPVDHVIRDQQNPGHYILLQAHHESRNPECVGHLRLEHRPWFQQTEGEKAPVTPKRKR